MIKSTLSAVTCVTLLVFVTPRAAADDVSLRAAASDNPGAPCSAPASAAPASPAQVSPAQVSVAEGSAAQGSGTGTTGDASRPSQDDPPESKSKHILGIIPNNRTSDDKEHKALTPTGKFSLAAEDSFDWGTYMLAAAFAGYGQLGNASPSFGHGVSGYARYWVAAYGDQAIGNLMTEAIYPVILHQDPRYFRRGTGSGWSRLGFAAGQIFVTHSDSGATRFNFSEIVGNLTAVGISNAYYPDNRDVPHAATKLGIQVATDMTGNILKEFWPDLIEAFSRIHHAGSGHP